MDIDRLVELLRSLPFHQAVWLLPLATALHFLEEAPHFADWASRYALPGYTHQRWRRIHGLGMVFAIAFCALASIFPNRFVVFLFFALCLSESVLNSLFHVGATAFSGVYCPGLITALLVYPPLYWYLSQLAYREGLLTNTLGVVAFLIAVVIHTVDVAMSVFGVKLQSHRHTT
ncbi:MAG TPA: HXXEE domain-containing protein [Terriglobales bacterium]|nr:HXXEE domain-containing protein [Terriglobales bacterium]